MPSTVSPLSAPLSVPATALPAARVFAPRWAGALDRRPQWWRRLVLVLLLLPLAAHAPVWSSMCFLARRDQRRPSVYFFERKFN